MPKYKPLHTSLRESILKEILKGKDPSSVLTRATLLVDELILPSKITDLISCFIIAKKIIFKTSTEKILVASCTIITNQIKIDTSEEVSIIDNDIHVTTRAPQYGAAVFNIAINPSHAENRISIHHNEIISCKDMAEIRVTDPLISETEIKFIKGTFETALRIQNNIRLTSAEIKF